MNPTLRYVIRCSLFGVSSFCSSLLTSMPDLTLNDLLQALLLGTVFALGYAGIGAGSSAMEPSVGRKG